MPFGLVNATSTFQRLMDRVLEGMGVFCAAYVDDILIFNKDMDQHLEHVKKVFEALQKAGLTAKKAKCEWGKATLEYLGHQVGDDVVAIPEHWVTVMREYVKPTIKKGVRAFLGMTGYYRRFIPHYGLLAKQLTKMTCKAEPERVQ